MKYSLASRRPLQFSELKEMELGAFTAVNLLSPAGPEGGGEPLSCLLLKGPPASGHSQSSPLCSERLETSCCQLKRLQDRSEGQVARFQSCRQVRIRPSSSQSYDLPLNGIRDPFSSFLSHSFSENECSQNLLDIRTPFVPP